MKDFKVINGGMGNGNSNQSEGDGNNMPMLFDYEGNQVRSVMINGEPWFVAKDVCEILEISNSRHATSRLPERMKDTVVLNDTIGRTKEMTIISEPGLYKLVVRSDKPEAERFTDWIVEEVLPAIRKTGHYSIPKMTTAEILHGITVTMLQLEQNQREQELQLAIVQQKIDYVEEDAKLVHTRINNLDRLNPIGNPRQQLKGMVDKYARVNAINYGEAWNIFKRSFNTAYGVNLTYRMNRYADEHGIKKLSMPEYLERVDMLDDAIRVMDKLLNDETVRVLF